MITKETTLEELAGIITAGLAKHKIDATLVGGAVVSIYSHNEYQSRDLGFISPNDHSKIVLAMEEMGFTRSGKDFIHPNTEFTVEFPTGPLAIGEEIPVKPEGKLDTPFGKVKLFSATQCVMDRLTWFYHNKDRQCLDQAIKVATSHAVNFSKIKKWSEKEGSLDKYEIFLSLIKDNKTK